MFHHDMFHDTTICFTALETGTIFQFSVACVLSVPAPTLFKLSLEIFDSKIEGSSRSMLCRLLAVLLVAVAASQSGAHAEQR